LGDIIYSVGLGGFITNLKRGDILNSNRRFNCETGQSRYLKIAPEFIITKLSRWGILNCFRSFYFPNRGDDVLETALGVFVLGKQFGAYNLNCDCRFFGGAGDFRYFKFDNREWEWTWI